MQWLLNLLNEMYLNIGLTLGFLSDDPSDAECQLIGVTLQPPSGSTLMVGQPITANVTYSSNLSAKPLQIWVQTYTSGSFNDGNDANIANGVNELGGSYEPSDLEAANGQVSRYFQVAQTGKLKDIAIIIQHYTGNELLFETRKVDYTFVPNPEREKLRDDGKSSKVKISKILADGFEIPANARVAIDTGIDVVVDYNNTSQHGASLSVMPSAEHEFHFGYEPSSPLDNGLGKKSKFFQVNEVTHIAGIHVFMTNAADEIIAEEWLPFPIEFYEPGQF